MSLYQEVRPDSLKDIVGNSSTIGGLNSLIRKPSSARNHAILLKGPSGCGKTTIARILAKEFGSTADSTFEYNAANTNGIETVREVARTAHLTAGFGSKVKTYIFDESHELTGKAQEALLKVLEEGPDHCYFIFCTTSPESLITTIHNRCDEFTVELLVKSEIKEVLHRACEIKNWKISSDIIEAVALTCEGSPRAALVSLGLVSEIEDVNVALELLVNGTERDKSVLDLMKLLVSAPAIRKKKWKVILQTYNAINSNSEVVRKSILTFLFNKMLKYDSIEDVQDIAHLILIFSTNTFYGKKPQLGSLLVRACFETWGD